jgi:hypothetical protein
VHFWKPRRWMQWCIAVAASSIVLAGCAGRAGESVLSATSTTSALSHPKDGACPMIHTPDVNHAEEQTSASVRLADGYFERTVTPIKGGDGRVEVSQVPFETLVTDREKQDVDEFVALVRAAVEDAGLDNPVQAKAEGYSPSQECSTHWSNRSYLDDGMDLDPSRPEFLVFYHDAKGELRMNSVMFTATGAKHGPQPFGALAVWHYHQASGGFVFCEDDGVAMRYSKQGDCPSVDQRPRTSEMLHVGIDPSASPFSGLM